MISYILLFFRGKIIAFADPLIVANFKLNKQKKNILLVQLGKPQKQMKGGTWLIFNLISETRSDEWLSLRRKARTVLKAAFRPGTFKNLRTQLNTYLLFCERRKHSSSSNNKWQLEVCLGFIYNILA